MLDVQHLNLRSTPSMSGHGLPVLLAALLLTARHWAVTCLAASP